MSLDAAILFSSQSFICFLCIKSGFFSSFFFRYPETSQRLATTHMGHCTPSSLFFFLSDFFFSQVDTWTLLCSFHELLICVITLLPRCILPSCTCKSPKAFAFVLTLNSTTRIVKWLSNSVHKKEHHARFPIPAKKAHHIQNPDFS